jgi:ABC-type antimicrobial peptide transport system permease subunit
MAWLPALRTALRDIDPEISLSAARPLQAAIDEQRSRPAFLAWLLTGFAGVAALLALVGVYGVIAYAVRQREREIAVRMAIGANPASITRLFVRQGGVVVLAGLALGVPAALVAGRAVETQLFGVRPTDAWSLAVTTVTFGVAGILAVWWPARRAAIADPAAALKDD